MTPPSHDLAWPGALFAADLGIDATVRRADTLWRELDRRLGPAGSLRVARQIGPESWHPTWLACMASPTLNVAARDAARLRLGVWSPLDVSVTSRDTTLTYRPAAAVADGLQVVELLLWLTIVQRLTTCPLRAMRLGGPRRPALLEAARALATPLREGPHFEITFAALDGQRPFLSTPLSGQPFERLFPHLARPQPHPSGN